MKKIYLYLSLLTGFTMLWGCEKDNYPGGRISPYIAIFDVRDLYKGQDVQLTTDALFGSGMITGMVVSDHSGGNMPAGLVAIQDRRRLSELRGISINIGADAASFTTGDSVVVNIAGGVLKRENGILQITGLTKNAFTKVSSGNAIAVNRVPNSFILANPENYESTEVVVVKAGFNPLPAAGDVLSGNKMLNDGFGDLTLHTAPTAAFANTPAPFLANFYGVVFNTVVSDSIVPQLRLRTGNDVVVLSSTVEVTPIVITGFMSDPSGSDGNYEYIQFKATRDINFAATPFSVVTTNNANASTPTGFPTNGWATGGLRTYKFNLTSGFAAKGTFFYVGGSGKLINGPAETTPVVKPASTSIAQANWIRAFNYSSTGGEGFGTATGNLLANSGNASGIAVFTGINVTVASVPIDVVFIGTSGSLWSGNAGYRISNSDFYDIKNPITLDDQPFYRSGSNTLSFAYLTSNIGYFNQLGGEYNATLGRWTTARTQNAIELTKTSALSEIEGVGATEIK